MQYWWFSTFVLSTKILRWDLCCHARLQRLSVLVMHFVTQPGKTIVFFMPWQTSKKSQKIDWLTLWCWWLKQSTLSDAPIDCCAGIMESLVWPDVTIPSALDKVKRLEQSGNMDIELGQCNLPKSSLNLRKYQNQYTNLRKILKPYLIFLLGCCSNM